MAAVRCRDLEGLVEIVYRECDAVHPYLVGTGRVRLDRVGMDVLEKLQASFAIRRLEHCDLGVIPVQPDGGVGPLSTDRVPAENAQPEIREEGDRLFDVANGDADVLELDGHGFYSRDSCRWWCRPSSSATIAPGTVRGSELVSEQSGPSRLLSNTWRT